MKPPVIKFLLLLISILFLHGCLAIPIPRDDPFPKEKIVLIKPGETTKASITEAFGKPDAVRLSGKIYVYAKAGGADIYWLIVIPSYYSAGVGAGEASANVTHLLIIEFDENDVISAAEDFWGESGKLESGLSVVNSGANVRRTGRGPSTYLSKGSWSFSSRRMILELPQEMDKQAKEFAPPLNKAIIFYYDYRNTNGQYLSRINSDSHEPQLDGKDSADPGSEGFLFWVVDPGQHVISNDATADKLTFNCEPQKIYYVAYNYGSIEEEDKSIGEKEITKRRRVCDRFDPFTLE